MPQELASLLASFRSSHFVLVFRAVAFSASVAAICVNVLFIHLLATRASQQTGRYRRVFYILALSDILYSCCVIATAPAYFITDGSVVVFFTGAAEGTPSVARVAMQLFYFAYAFLLIIVDVGFVYRFLLVINSDCADWFHHRRPFAFIYSLAAATAAAFSCLPFIKANTPAQFMAIASKGDVGPQDASFMAYYLNMDRQQHLAINGTMLFLELFASVTTASFGLSIHRRLKHSTLSERTKRMHRRAVVILALQAAVPVVCLCVPFLEIMANFYLLRTSPAYSILLAPLPPLLDPLVVILLTSEYGSSLTADYGRATLAVLCQRRPRLLSFQKPSGSPT